MTMVSRLSVVTAYVAFAFVGAIVIGVFEASRSRLEANRKTKRPVV